MGGWIPPDNPALPGPNLQPARFQAKLKSQVGSECGKNLKQNNDRKIKCSHKFVVQRKVFGKSIFESKKILCVRNNF